MTIMQILRFFHVCRRHISATACAVTSYGFLTKRIYKIIILFRFIIKLIFLWYIFLFSATNDVALAGKIQGQNISASDFFGTWIVGGETTGMQGIYPDVRSFVFGKSNITVIYSINNAKNIHCIGKSRYFVKYTKIEKNTVYPYSTYGFTDVTPFRRGYITQFHAFCRDNSGIPNNTDFSFTVDSNFDLVYSQDEGAFFFKRVRQSVVAPAKPR